MSFDKAMELAALPAGTSAMVIVGGKDVALFNVGGTVYAIDDSCIHMGASLAAGRFEGVTVTCLAHGLRFDVTTGKIVGNDEVGVQAYPVKIEEGVLMVAVS